MKRFILLSLIVCLGMVTYAQSPLKTVSFHKNPNEIVDLRELKEKAGRDSDLDGNKAARIRVKAQGFDENKMLGFTVFPRPGMEVIYKEFQQGEMWVYVSSKVQGTLVIKYMGEFEFKLPSKLEPKCGYDLVLGMETGTLVIKTVPTNAEIYIDNEKVGTGYASKAVALGAEHTYKVQCVNYYPKEGRIYFSQKEDKSLDVELDPNFGYITIKSEPSGAEVYVDEVKVGVTPYMAERVLVGEHRIEIKKQGCFSFVDIVNIKVGEHNKQFENVKLEKDENQVEQIVVENTNNTKVSDNKISKVTDGFSVSPDKSVYFSKGNLQYQASTNTWRFAEHQWDHIGEDNKNISPTYDGWIDLFGWGTSGYKGREPYMTSTVATDYVDVNINISGTNYDWGLNNTIANGEGRRWYTLTQQEWYYLCNKRKTTSGIRYAMAKVNGVRGIILLPDNWRSSIYHLKKVNKNDAICGYGKNKISQSDWIDKFETNGAVFLPVTGIREGTNVSSIDTDGRYWLSNVSEYLYDEHYDEHEYVYAVEFWVEKLMGSTLFWTWGNMPSYGYSVRLVCPAEN